MKQWTAETARPDALGDMNSAGRNPSGGSMEARKKALRLLEFRDRTEKELTERLLKEGFSEEETEDAAAYAASFGYINDLRYACIYIRGRMQTKSRRTISGELMRKGISPETLEAAWEEIAEEEPQDENRIIREWILKKYRAGSQISLKEYRNLCAGLARRGFSYDDIMHELSSLEISWND